MRAVLDTNVLISGVIATGVPHEILAMGYECNYEIVASFETISEFRRNLSKYPEKFGMTADEIQRDVETVQYFAEIVEPSESISAVDADPDDDKFLEAAVAGNADVLVSGDTHLLDLDSFRGIDVVDPRTFYDRLENA